MTTPTKEHIARIRWQCRRGMLELDVILEDFLDQHYLQLTAADQQLFERLLMGTDQELYEWLLDKNQAVDSELARMVDLIRHSREK